MTTTLENPPVQQQPPARTVSGVLDIDASGKGHLRGENCLPTPADTVVSPALIRRYGLRKGDLVEGVTGDRRGLTDVAQVDGRTPGDLRGRRHFRDLTPKTGKTVLLQQVAAAVTGNHPECRLMMLLLDERPEEVTDMRRCVQGEVYASTFDRSAKQHIALADLVIERAKRFVEAGEDVVVLLDSLTRLCRAHNNAAASGGRILTGGVDASALTGPKRFFGAARTAEEGGSLTILATALVETGSRADDFYFEELKSTGNMELRLSRDPASRRVFPAVDITPSGTRREELLLRPAELAAVHGLRRVLRGRDGQGGLETLLERMRETPDNATFLRRIQPTLPAD